MPEERALHMVVIPLPILLTVHLFRCAWIVYPYCCSRALGAKGTGVFKTFSE